MNTEYDERITTLEMKLTFLEDFVTKLQETAVVQGHELDALKIETKAMRAKIIELTDAQEGTIPNVRPPHY